MKKILFTCLFAFSIVGCSKQETSNQFICTLQDNNSQESIIIEHTKQNIDMIKATITKKHDNLEDAYSDKDAFDYTVCELGNNYYCNSYVLENKLTVIKEWHFAPATHLSTVDAYKKHLENEGYTCTILKDTN